nr:hypothetical protein [Tanacetum cinerariifolium]
MIELVIHTVKIEMVIHTDKTEMMRLVVEIEYVGKIVDGFDKATGSFDGFQPEKVDLNYVHALNEPHLHEIRVVSNFKEYMLRDYCYWLKTYNYWYKLKLLDNAADPRLSLLEESTVANEKMKK